MDFLLYNVRGGQKARYHPKKENLLEDIKLCLKL